MKRGIVLLLVVCGLADAMVSRDRRAVNTEEEGTKTITICLRQTPCAWSSYNTKTKALDYKISNSYCSCGPGTECVKGEEESSINAFTHWCQPRNGS